MYKNSPVHCLLIGAFLVLIGACKPSQKMTENPPPAGQVTKGPKKDHFLKDLLAQYPQYFEAVLKNPDTLGVQIIYTQINRDKNNKPSLVDYYYNVNPEKYFYPASTVKMN
jgi:hypothetical protein